jgi:hypothetical protein
MWSCLDRVEWPESESTTATVGVTFMDLVNFRAVAGVRARFCGKFDPTCTEGVIAGTEGLVSDDNGIVQAELPVPFDGFVMFEGPFGESPKVPGSYFFYPPVTRSRVVPPIPLMAQEVLDVLAEQAGQPVDPGDGHVMLAAYNCASQVTAGVRLSSDRFDVDTRAFYVVQRVPTTTALETDESGWGGLINVPPGATQVSGTLSRGSRHIGTASLNVTAGRVTYTALVPSP